MSVSDDPLGVLAEALRKNEPVPIHAAVACVDMRPVWGACQDASCMIEVLARVDQVIAARCAIACVRVVVGNLSTANREVACHALDSAVQFLDSGCDEESVAESISACRPLADSGIVATRVALSAVLAAIDACIPGATFNGHWTAPAATGSPTAIAVRHAASMLADRNGNEGYIPYDFWLRRYVTQLHEMANTVRLIVPVPPKIDDVVKATTKNR